MGNDRNFALKFLSFLYFGGVIGFDISMGKHTKHQERMKQGTLDHMFNISRPWSIYLGAHHRNMQNVFLTII